MGYTTEFSGEFKINKPLDDDTYKLLDGLSKTRRMARNVGPEYGVEGEFYIEGSGFMGQDDEDNVINSNQPPKTQPGLWCQWRPTDDKEYIEWDGGEKFYNYVEWIEYIIEKILRPRGYSLTGQVAWYGEESEDTGFINIEDNEVRTEVGETFYFGDTDEDRRLKIAVSKLTIMTPQEKKAASVLLETFIEGKSEELEELLKGLCVESEI